MRGLFLYCSRTTPYRPRHTCGTFCSATGGDARGPDHMQTDWIDITTAYFTAKLAVRRVGTGPAILFLHGWAHSSVVWQEVIPHFSPTNTCISVDLPGFGESPPLARKHIALDRYADIVWQLLHDLTKAQPIDLVVADSMGGQLVVDCMSRLETLSTKRFFLSGVPLDGLPKVLRDVQAHAFTGFGLQLLQLLPFPIANLLTTQSNHLTVYQRGKFERLITAMIRQCDSATASRLLREMYYPYELSQHFVPDRYEIVLCRGLHDQVFRDAALEPWAQALRATPITLPNAGHTSMLETPDEYARAITAAWTRPQATSIESR